MPEVVSSNAVQNLLRTMLSALWNSLTLSSNKITQSHALNTQITLVTKLLRMDTELPSQLREMVSFLSFICAGNLQTNGLRGLLASLERAQYLQLEHKARKELCDLIKRQLIWSLCRSAQVSKAKEFAHKFFNNKHENVNEILLNMEKITKYNEMHRDSKPLPDVMPFHVFVKKVQATLKTVYDQLIEDEDGTCLGDEDRHKMTSADEALRAVSNRTRSHQADVSSSLTSKADRSKVREYNSGKAASSTPANDFSSVFNSTMRSVEDDDNDVVEAQKEAVRGSNSSVVQSSESTPRLKKLTRSQVIEKKKDSCFSAEKLQSNKKRKVSLDVSRQSDKSGKVSQISTDEKNESKESHSSRYMLPKRRKFNMKLAYKGNGDVESDISLDSSTEELLSIPVLTSKNGNRVHTRKRGLRKIRQMWTVEEEAALMLGVEKFSKSTNIWSNILSEYRILRENGRTGENLRDKHRNLLKAGRCRDFQMLDFVTKK